MSWPTKSSVAWACGCRVRPAAAGSANSGSREKKFLHASEQQRPGVKALREQWISTITQACRENFTRELSLTYVEFALVPALRPGDVVVMDNLPGHHLPRVRQLVEAADATLLYLPPYSPDFDPIEMIRSKVKRLLRSIAARTVRRPAHGIRASHRRCYPGRHCQLLRTPRLQCYNFRRAALNR